MNRPQKPLMSNPCRHQYVFYVSGTFFIVVLVPLRLFLALMARWKINIGDVSPIDSTGANSIPTIDLPYVVDEITRCLPDALSVGDVFTLAQLETLHMLFTGRAKARLVSSFSFRVLADIYGCFSVKRKQLRIVKSSLSPAVCADLF